MRGRADIQEHGLLLTYCLVIRAYGRLNAADIDSSCSSVPHSFCAACEHTYFAACFAIVCVAHHDK